MKELNDNWNEKLPHLLDFFHTIPIKFHNETASKIREHYLNDNPIDKQNSRSVVKMVGDRLFKVDAEKAARLQANANKSPVLFYHYSYRATDSISDLFSRNRKDFG